MTKPIKIELELELDELITLRYYLDNSMSKLDMSVYHDEYAILEKTIEILDQAIEKFADVVLAESNNNNNKRQNIAADLSRHLKG